MTNTNGALPALGRLFLSVIFILGGYGKLMAAGPTIGYIAAHGLPVPQAAYAVSVAVELGGGLLILVGFQARLVALGLAAWCLVTGALFHFAPGDQANTIQLLKNIAMAGGFLQIAAYGAGAWSIDAMMGRRDVATAA